MGQANSNVANGVSLNNAGPRPGTRIAGSPNGVGTNSRSPISFHSTHSENIRVSRDGAIARRVESFCKGISFSNRSVKVNEKIYLKVAETSSSWSGVLRFGFTSNDPSNIRSSSLPKYTCPDMTNKPGNWGKALAERYAQRDNILFFYVTQSGDVYYGVNGEEKGVFFGGVDVSGCLWALIDVYGNTIAIEIVDPNQHLNNNRGRSNNPETDVINAFSTLTFQDDQTVPSRYHANVQFDNLPFHTRTKGHNIMLSSNANDAMRKPTEFSHGFVFTSRPLKVGEIYVIQILKTDNVYVSSLAFGFTSCDPARVSPRELPQDSDHLLDRPEYWVVSKDVANSPQKGDELEFRIAENGEVRFQKNNLAPVTIMHVDHSLKLWAFANVYGSTIKIRSLGSYMDRPYRQLSTNLHPISLTSSQSNLCNNSAELMSGGDGTQDNARNECAVCYERPIDCVLYMCGHMCMCFECAVHQWRGEGAGQCPICRAMIRDVIRIYKS